MHLHSAPSLVTLHHSLSHALNHTLVPPSPRILNRHVDRPVVVHSQFEVAGGLPATRHRAVHDHSVPGGSRLSIGSSSRTASTLGIQPGTSPPDELGFGYRTAPAAAGGFSMHLSEIRKVWGMCGECMGKVWKARGFGASGVHFYCGRALQALN